MEDIKKNGQNRIGKIVFIGGAVFLIGFGIINSFRGGSDRPQELQISLNSATAAEQPEESSQELEGEQSAEEPQVDASPQATLNRLEIGRNAQLAALIESLGNDGQIAICHRARQYLSSAEQARQERGIPTEVWLQQQSEELVERAKQETSQVTAFNGSADHQSVYRELYWEATALSLAFDNLWRANPLNCPVLTPWVTWAQLDEINNASKAVRNARQQ